ncbi:hypothetical protein SAMN05444156_2766 [Verrucomicrobium sp. GAS474]|uniref:hypothetical protein n=1 Tax=Verrucomicrobium sp. GAS474 TaxID=1882831 RepID=UPI00087DAA9A|nr:hypothetical protein [Verrucomicrobium sp. GAS474]SDU23472.1 hypothetical protein SAMN05444156_2766 [Verrucomicrobium sp. GAS474]
MPLSYILLQAHSGVRWLVLAAGLVSVSLTFIGWKYTRPWTRAAKIAGTSYVGFLDLQLLLGILLYAIDPLTRAFWQAPGEHMKDGNMRFFAIEHVTFMVLAVALAHVGSVLARKATTDEAKYSRLFFFHVGSFLLLLAGIPWHRLAAAAQ